jgi:nitrogen fixation-related uncharacterized protein
MDVFTILIPVALLAVLITLGLGLFALFQGRKVDEQGPSKSNQLMRMRVALQAVAILVLVAAFWWRGRGLG